MTSLIARGVALPTRLHPTSLTVDAPSLLALVGPNGGGKTSLLRSIARVEQSSGQLLIDGEDLDNSSPARRRHLLSFLPASRAISWPISARDVIMLGLDRDNPARVDELIDELELGSIADRPANQLSTGERARVLMGRALASRPKLLLLDEPLSNLDPYWVIRFLQIFRQSVRSGQILLVAVHDLAQLPHFDRAILIADGSMQLDKAPAELMANERFEEIFRIAATADGGWTVRPREDLQSSR